MVFGLGREGVLVVVRGRIVKRMEREARRDAGTGGLGVGSESGLDRAVSYGELGVREEALGERNKGEVGLKSGRNFRIRRDEVDGIRGVVLEAGLSSAVS